MKNRRYYAEYCPYGVNISYVGRQKCLRPYGKLVAAATKLENVRYCKGRNFKVCNTVVIQNEYEIDDYLHGKEIKE